MTAPIDLRSDTVTRPTAAMRAAMAAAPVGDDQFAEDPSINALQERCAELLGKEAALGARTVRAVTHLDVTRQQSLRAADTLAAMLAESGS